MSNPYDFTSGFLAARKMRQDESDSKAINEYRKGMLGVYGLNAYGNFLHSQETTRNLKLKNDLTEKIAPFMDNILGQSFGQFGFQMDNAPKGSNNQGGTPMPFGGGKSNMPTGPQGGDVSPVDPYGMQGGRMMRTSLDNSQTQNGYGITPPASPESEKLIEAANGGYIRPLRFSDGGAMDDENINATAQRQYGIQTPAETVPVESVAQDNYQSQQPEGMMTVGAKAKAPPMSEFQKYASENPTGAMDLYKNVSNFKNQSKMIAGMALIDWAREKTSSKDLLGTIENLKQIQREGIYEATSKFLQGDMKGGVELYKQYGNDNGDFAVRKRTIEEVDPTSPKGAKRKRDVFDLQFDNGQTSTLDPLHLALDTLSAKARIEQADRDVSHRLTERGQDIHQDSNNASRENQRYYRDRDEYMRWDAKGNNELNTIATSELKSIDNDPGLKINSEARAIRERDTNARLAKSRELYQLSLDEFARTGKPPVSARSIYEGLYTGKLGNREYVPIAPVAKP